jgi:valyl-tRNA synthetase
VFFLSCVEKTKQTSSCIERKKNRIVLWVFSLVIAQSHSTYVYKMTSVEKTSMRKRFYPLKKRVSSVGILQYWLFLTFLGTFNYKNDRSIKDIKCFSISFHFVSLLLFLEQTTNTNDS